MYSICFWINYINQIREIIHKILLYSRIRSIHTQNILIFGFQCFKSRICVLISTLKNTKIEISLSETLLHFQYKLTPILWKKSKRTF